MCCYGDQWPNNLAKKELRRLLKELGYREAAKVLKRTGNRAKAFELVKEQNARRVT
jgi:hypothetical protein